MVIILDVPILRIIMVIKVQRDLQGRPQRQGICLPSHKGATLTGKCFRHTIFERKKILLKYRANFLRKYGSPFGVEFFFQESKSEVVSLVRMVARLWRCIQREAT